jgi:hypothetical protein
MHQRSMGIDEYEDRPWNRQRVSTDAADRQSTITYRVMSCHLP